MSAQREAFERVMAKNHLDFTRRPHFLELYQDDLTRMAWLAWLEAQAAMQAELAQLRGFAAATMDYWPEDSIDGGELQDIAETHGLLTLEIAHQPCGESCRCVEYVTEAQFEAGMPYYRKSKVLLDAQTARNAKDAA